MNLKNKFCQSVDPANFMPPVTEIPGSAPAIDLCDTCFHADKYYYVQLTIITSYPPNQRFLEPWCSPLQSFNYPCRCPVN